MAKKRKRKDAPEPGAPATDNLRLDPEQRLVSRFDSAGIAKYPVAEPGEMGFRVVDDAVEEHMM